MVRWGPTRPCGRSPGWRRLWVAGTRPVPDPDDAACLAALGPHGVADRQMLNRYLAGRDCKMFWIASHANQVDHLTLKRRRMQSTGSGLDETPPVGSSRCQSRWGDPTDRTIGSGLTTR